MPSILPDYEYDIFISYRHNDNRSGWVTEFVKALEEELAATIKDPLSIYFDKNPHDGLLETHHVDKSLEGKLKCLIFIPIISQTYCDPKSFAWQHEFVAFNQLAQADSLGRDIKLNNGNVASRILPVQIHELDADDKHTLETEIGGVLRAIEFLYKETGVNRPLKSSDDRTLNLANADYQNQVNKVANAAKELVAVLKSPQTTAANSNSKTPIQKENSPQADSSNHRVFYLLGAAALIFLGFLWWQMNPEEKAIEKAGVVKSLVVLPFKDMSPNQDQEWFSDGLAEEMLNRLAKVKDLKLISRTTAFSFKNKGLTAKAIADSLGVSYVLEGSVRKANNQIRITAQLINAVDDSHIWSNTYDRSMDSIFAVQDDLSESITQAMNILLDDEERGKLFDSGTRSIEAYEELLKGNLLFNRAHLVSLDLLKEANKHYDKAITIDPGFGKAYYKRQDYYSHNLLADDLEGGTGLTKDEIYERMIEDIDAAIKFSNSEEDKLAYQFDRHFLSNNWKELPRLTKLLKDRKRPPPGWGSSLFLITEPQYTSERKLEELKNDPYNDVIKVWLSMALLNVNLNDSALAVINKGNTDEKVARIIETIVLLKMDDYQKAFEVLREKPALDTIQYVITSLLAGSYPAGRAELNNFLQTSPSVISSFGSSLLQIYNILGEYDEADSLASIYDRRFLSSVMFITNIHNYGLSFHLSATPNFSARLNELGIDPEAFEKKHYRQFPVIKLE